MSKDDPKARADIAFKKVARAIEGVKAVAENEAAGRAVREKTARLRAQRLDKEAADAVHRAGHGAKPDPKAPK